MVKSNIKCKDCGQFLYDVRGIGDDKLLLICINNGCISNTGVIKCPYCSSIENHVVIPGIGVQIYECHKCRKQFEQ